MLYSLGPHLSYPLKAEVWLVEKQRKEWSLLASFSHLLVYSFILSPSQRVGNRVQGYMRYGDEGTEMSRDCSDCSPVNGKA